MSKITISYERNSKFPDWATPEVLKTMKSQYKTLRQIASICGVSAEAVRQRILKAKV